MGNSASGEEGGQASPDPKKSKKKSRPPKEESPPEEEISEQVSDKENLEKTSDKENLENKPPASEPRAEPAKTQREKQNPETGSLHSSCVSIPDLIDAVNSPDYDPNLPFFDSETGKPLFKKNDPFTKDEGEGKVPIGNDVADDRPVKYTRENDLDQMSITNDERL